MTGLSGKRTGSRVGGMVLLAVGVAIGLSWPAGEPRRTAVSAAPSGTKTGSAAKASGAPAAKASSDVIRPKDLPAEPAPIARPGTELRWKVAVVHDQPTLTADAEGSRPLTFAEGGPSRPSFGDTFFVVSRHTVPGAGGRTRVLLAAFKDAYGDEFARLVGWADPDELLWREEPLRVREARAEVLESVAGYESRARLAGDIETSERMLRLRQLLDNELPIGERKDADMTTLKAVTQPKKGRMCYPRPMTPEQERNVKQYPGLLGEPVESFSFFYIYKLVVRDGFVHALISPRPITDLLRAETSQDLRGQLKGWLELSNLKLWSNREALEYNLTEDARTARRTCRPPSPIELYSTRSDLISALKARMAARPSPARPVFTEDFAAAFMQKPLDPDVMRYPILDTYELPGGPLADGRKRLGFQLCVLGSSRGENQALNLDTGKLKQYQRLIGEALETMRVLEIVVVVDRSAAMADSFDALRETLKKAVADQVARETEARTSKSDRWIAPRVAVVSYWNHPEQDRTGKTPRLTEDSGKFFEVMSDQGRQEFEKYLDGLKTVGGSSPRREPFEGISTAVQKFLSTKPGSVHSRGAAQMVVLVGNAGNHEKSDGPPVRLGVDDVAALLRHASDDRVGGSGLPGQSKIVLHTVYAAGRDGKVCPGWAKQMPTLVEQTGGTALTVSLSDPAGRTEAASRLRLAIRGAVDARRDRLSQEIRTIQRMFISEPMGGDGPAVPFTEFDSHRLAEVIPRDQLDKARGALQEFYFTTVHAMARTDDDPPNRPRMEVRILLTEEELTKLMITCDRISLELSKQLNNLQTNPDPLLFKRLMVQTMLLCMNEDRREIDEAEIDRRARRESLEQLQLQASRLPVVFGCLSGHGPRSRSEAEALAARLRRVSGDLKAILSQQRERLFDTGLGTKQMHIWMKTSELP